MSCWISSLRGMLRRSSSAESPADSMLKVPDRMIRSKKVWRKDTSVIFDKVMSLPDLLRMPLRTMTRWLVMT